jgi:ligand-binding sensor domain-containing protein
MNSLKNMKIKILTIAIFFLIINNILFCQITVLQFNKILSNKELQCNEVRYFFTDHFGFKWFATDNGLIRYDGYRIKTFRHNTFNPQSIASDNTHMIIEDNEKTLWISTTNGLSRYLPKYESFINFYNSSIDPSTISDNNLNKIYTSTNYIFIPTKKTFDLLDLKTLKVKHVLYPYNNFEVKTFVADYKNKIWLIDKQNNLYYFDPKSPKFIPFNFNRPDYNFECLYVDTAGFLWIGYNNNSFEIFDLENEKCLLSYEDLPNELKNLSISQIVKFDKENNLLIGSKTFTFNLKSKKFSYINSIPLQLNNPIPIIIANDNNENIWVISKDNEIFISCPFINRFKNNLAINNHPVSSNRSFNTAFYDDKKVLWIGTDYGLNKITDTILIKTYTNFNFKNSSKILAINQDKKGRIFIATEKGALTRFEPENENFLNFAFNSSLKNDPLHPGDETYINIFADKLNFWLIGANGVIDLFDPVKNIFEHSYIDSIINASVFDDNYIYCSTGKKIYSFNKSDRTIKKLNISELKENMIINHIFKTKEIIWIATNKGLINYNGKDSKIINEIDGYELNDLLQIQADNDNLWISTDNALIRYNPETSKVFYFNETDGIINNMNKSCKTNDEIFFGGTKGFISFNTKNLLINNQPSNVVISSIKIYNKPVEVDPNSILTQSTVTSDKITFSNKHKMFSLEFAVLNFIANKKIKYAYKLEGWENKWIYTDVPSATFTNIKPGKYTFKVKASNIDGFWGDQYTELKILIKKPFWRTNIFYLLILILISLIIYKLYKIQKNKIETERQTWEQKFTEALIEVEQKSKEIEEQNKALLEKQAEDERRNWISEGMNEFTDMLRENTSGLQAFAYNIISKLTSYIGANIGVLYIRNDDDEKNIFYKIEAAVAYNQKKVMKAQYKITEGLIGSCAYERKTFYFTDIPQDYVKIASGLGQAPPRSLLIVPCVFNETVFGIIEMASLNEIEDYKIKFVEELGEKIASTISIVLNNERTAKLLQQSKEQANLLMTNEEELRQNLEEMRATQEQSEKREMELLAENEALKKENAELKIKIRNLQTK